MTVKAKRVIMITAAFSAAAALTMTMPVPVSRAEVTGTQMSEDVTRGNRIPDRDKDRILEDVRLQAKHDSSREARADATYAALKLAGTADYRFGGGHTKYTSERSVKDLSDFTETDDSGFISYLLYKSNAAAFTENNALSNVNLKDIGVKIPASKSLKPGDILISRGKSHLHHSVMYLGHTTYGNFTIAECTVHDNKSGPQINGYQSYRDFIKQRGKYIYMRDPFKTIGRVTTDIITDDDDKTAKISFFYQAPAVTGSAITADNLDYFRLCDITKNKKNTAGSYRYEKDGTYTCNPVIVTLKIPKGRKTFKYAVYDGDGLKRSRTITVKFSRNGIVAGG